MSSKREMAWTHGGVIEGSESTSKEAAVGIFTRPDLGRRQGLRKWQGTGAGCICELRVAETLSS